MNQQLLTQTQAAKQLGLDPRTLKKATQTNQIPHLHTPRRTWIPAAALTQPWNPQHQLPTGHPNPRVATIPTTAKQLGLDPRTITWLINHGQIPSIQIGRRHLIPTQWTHDFLNGHPHHPDAYTRILPDTIQP